MCTLKFHHLHKYIFKWKSGWPDEQWVNKQKCKRIQTECGRGRFKSHLLWQTHKASVFRQSFSLLHTPFTDTSEVLFAIHAGLDAASEQTQTGKHTPRHSLWRGSVCICPSALLLAAAAGQSRLASAGNSPEPYMRYLNTHTYTEIHIRMSPKSLTGFSERSDTYTHTAARRLQLLFVFF